MSRIGKKPILIPEKVEIEIKNDHVVVKGPEGTIERALRTEIKLVKKDDQLLVKLKKGHEEANNFQGLFRSLINNDIQGVTKKFIKKLELRGVGYRAQEKGSTIVLEVGFSHPVEIEAPAGIEFEIEKKKITVKGIRKDLVGQVAAKIRYIRPPEPYKGKGIRYLNETVHRKEGKKAISLTD